MNINDLKKESIDMKEKKESVELARVNALESFEDFIKTCNALNEPTTKAVAAKKLELGGEFREYFSKNGFTVENEKKGKYKAIFEETVVILEDDHPDECEDGSIFSFQIPIQQKYDAIVIKVEQANEDKLYWKNNLKYDGRSIDFENFRELILSIENIKELEILLIKIKENIEWYEETKESFDNIKFVYSIYKTDREFETFQEIFEAL